MFDGDIYPRRALLWAFATTVLAATIFVLLAGESEIPRILVGVLAVMSAALLLYIVWEFRLSGRSLTSQASDIQDHLIRRSEQVEAMVEWALDGGKEVEATDIAVTHRSAQVSRRSPEAWPFYGDLQRKLAATHASLSKLVHPAVPATVAEIRQARRSAFPPWLSVRIVNHLLLISFIAVPLFVWLGVTSGDQLDELLGGASQASTDTGCLAEAGDSCSGQQQGRAFFAALYLLLAAALGAVFAALTKVSRSLTDATYQAREESRYWVSMILGMIAGALLSVVIARIIGVERLPLGGGGEKGGQNSSVAISVALLAVLGGFSSDLVYRIIERIIDAFDTIISGPTADRIQTTVQREVEATRIEYEVTRLETVAALGALKERLVDAESSGGTSTAELRKAFVVVSKLIGLPGDAFDMAGTTGSELDEAAIRDRVVALGGDPDGVNVSGRTIHVGRIPAGRKRDILEAISTYAPLYDVVADTDPDTGTQ